MTTDKRPSYPNRIRELPLSEQPRWRMVQHGPAALSDAELLTIILGSGLPGMTALDLAQTLLASYDGWNGLQRHIVGELIQSCGLGEAKAAQIKAALEIGRRLLPTNPRQRPQITSPTDVADLLQVEMAHLEQEHLRAVLLTNKYHVIRIETIYIGSINSASVRVGEVFRTALRHNAAALVLAHNHPSGDADPSPNDVQVTRAIIEGGALLGVDVVDHLIIGHGCFTSLREQGLAWRG